MGIIELIVAVLFSIFAYKKINEEGKIAEWSWWRVTSPLWIYAIFMIIFFFLFFGFVGTIFLTLPT